MNALHGSSPSTRNSCGRGGSLVRPGRPTGVPPTALEHAAQSCDSREHKRHRAVMTWTGMMRRSRRRYSRKRGRWRRAQPPTPAGHGCRHGSLSMSASIRSLKAAAASGDTGSPPQRPTPPNRGVLRRSSRSRRSASASRAARAWRTVSLLTCRAKARTAASSWVRCPPISGAVTPTRVGGAWLSWGRSAKPGRPGNTSSGRALGQMNKLSGPGSSRESGPWQT